MMVRHLDLATLILAPFALQILVRLMLFHAMLGISIFNKLVSAGGLLPRISQHWRSTSPLRWRSGPSSSRDRGRI